MAIKKHAQDFAEWNENVDDEAEALSVLLLEGMRQVDATYAENISKNLNAARFLEGISDKYDHETIVSSSGYSGSLFEMSESDYNNARVNYDQLWNIEHGVYPGGGSETGLIKDMLLYGSDTYMIDDPAFGSYHETFDYAADQASDAQFEQFAWITSSALAFPAAVSTATTAAMQAQFWGGTSAHVGRSAMQRIGSSGYAGLNAIRNGASVANVRLGMVGSELLYGKMVPVTAAFAATSGTAGIGWGARGRNSGYAPCIYSRRHGQVSVYVLL